MYAELAKLLRAHAEDHCPLDGASGICGCVIASKAADAIEERDRYALTIQHEMMAEAESHIALVERLNKQIEELQKQVAHRQGELVKSMCGEWLAEDEKSRWIPVTERLPKYGERVLVFGGVTMYVAYYDKNRYGGEIWHKLNSKSHYCNPTHWLPLPEPPKEEA